ncbi:amidohydrolase family protein [Endomicrobium sp. AH-315-J14]|nr:amidohydrolase family protein [Endomicrobium sp. AH-315-J14]
MFRIEAKRLIPGKGAPIDDGCVILDGKRIAYAGPKADAPTTTEAKRIEVNTVMPGMWDCHVHFLGLTEANLDSLMRVPLPVAAARCVADAEKALMAGFTSVREVGGLGVYLARVVNEGTVPGPHIYAAGQLLSQTGGHGDLHGYPLGCISEFSERGGCLHLCDGHAECLRAVRMQLRVGARVIKICASGGVMSELDHPVHQQFSDPELEAIVAEAARADRVVAAHCHGKPGIMAALNAGVRTIEHGSYLDAEAAELMKEKKALLVPTRFLIERFLSMGKDSGIPDYAWDKLVAIAERHAEALALAIKSGVRIALGTDIATTGPDSGCPFGMHADELSHLVAAGMTPLAAIEAATASGPLTLGPQAPLAGQLLEGYDADVLGLASDPLSDVSTLSRSENLVAIWKSGELVKGSA